MSASKNEEPMEWQPMPQEERETTTWVSRFRQRPWLVAAAGGSVLVIGLVAVGLLSDGPRDLVRSWSLDHPYPFSSKPSFGAASDHAAAAVGDAIPAGKVDLAVLLRPTSWIEDTLTAEDVWPVLEPNKYDYPVRNLTVYPEHAQLWNETDVALANDAACFHLPIPSKMTRFPISITPDKLIVGLNAWRVDELHVNNEFLGKHGVLVHAFWADTAESRKKVWDDRYILPSHINIQFRGPESGSKKWLEMIGFLDEAAGPEVEWLVLADSDTLFFRNNLFTILDHFDASQPLCLGSPSDSSRQNVNAGGDMAFGGGGVVISRVLAKQFIPYIQPCLEKYSYQMGGDMRLKICMKEFLGLNYTLVPFFRQCDGDYNCAVEYFEHSYLVASRHRPYHSAPPSPHTKGGLHGQWMHADIADSAGDKWLRRFAWTDQQSGKKMVLTNGLTFVVYDPPAEGQTLDLENIEMPGNATERETYWMPTIGLQPAKRYTWAGQLWRHGAVVANAYEAPDGAWTVLFCEGTVGSEEIERLELRLGLSLPDDPILRLCDS